MVHISFNGFVRIFFCFFSFVILVQNPTQSLAVADRVLTAERIGQASESLLKQLSAIVLPVWTVPGNCIEARLMKITSGSENTRSQAGQRDLVQAAFRRWDFFKVDELRYLNSAYKFSWAFNQSPFSDLEVNFGGPAIHRFGQQMSQSLDWEVAFFRIQTANRLWSLNGLSFISTKTKEALVLLAGSFSNQSGCYD